jgi:hypothetical protein
MRSPLCHRYVLGESQDRDGGPDWADHGHHGAEGGHGKAGEGRGGRHHEGLQRGCCGGGQIHVLRESERGDGGKLGPLPLPPATTNTHLASSFTQKRKQDTPGHVLLFEA